MEFRIADTFTDSLARLTGEEQKVVKQTAFDLQVNPANPGMQLHRLDRARDKNFWSVRAGSDLRLIVHRTTGSLLLCYVDHHNRAYEWAERRALQTHPQTGAAQLVELVERIEEVIVPRYVEVDAPRPALFANTPDDLLLRYGVPEDWLPTINDLRSEDALLELVLRLPQEAGEALLGLATGERPPLPPEPGPVADPFEHPDALRRFRAVKDADELAAALAFPWEKWTVFLHPAQREAAYRLYGGPARVTGSAGTGKTIVALRRAAHLARANPDARVLLTTFSPTLADLLRRKLRVLLTGEMRLADQIEIQTLKRVAQRLYDLNVGRARLASPEVIRELIAEAAASEARFNLRFLLSEWADVVDAWQLDSWEAYRDVARLGRRMRLPEKQRAALWAVFERVRAGLRERVLVTESEVYAVMTARLRETGRLPYDFVVVDEAQDVSVPQLRFLATLGAANPDSLFFAGDLGQRIFQAPFSWKALGVDVRGRSRTLRVNYRTSHQIRAAADRLLGPEISDADGNLEGRRGTMSVFTGPEPELDNFPSPAAEATAAGEWLLARIAEGMQPREVGVFVRSDAQIARGQAAVDAAGLDAVRLDDAVEPTDGHVAIGTMPLAKGLEFRAVAVLACDAEVIPLQARIETAADEGELEEVYNTERHLLYVACTRARERLLVTSAGEASEFLDDLRA